RQLVEGRLELLLDFGRRVVPAQADVLEGELLEVELPAGPVVEPLVEEAVHPLRYGTLEREVRVDVEPLEVLGLEALEYDVAPREPREHQFLLLAPVRGLPLPPLGLVEDDGTVQHVELCINPRLGLLVP